MEVLKVSSMPDGTKIQLEDWSDDYDFIPPSSTLAAYPKSQVDKEGQFAPKKGRTLRVSFNFPTSELTEQAFNDLETGNKQLIEFKEHINNPEIIECI